MASNQCVMKETLSYEENACLNDIINYAENSYDHEEIVNKSLALAAKDDDDQNQVFFAKNKQPFVGNAGQNQAIFGNAGQNQPRFGNAGQNQGLVGIPPAVPVFIGIGLAKQVTVVAGALRNQTKGALSRLNSKKWAGHIWKDCPTTISSHGSGAFTISALSDKGVKAGVAYTGKNSAGIECAWLLAWVDTKATGKKIYAECGRRSKFSCINWSQIEKNLDSAGMVAKPSDKETGTSVYATIVGAVGKSVVAAAFTTA